MTAERKALGELSIVDAEMHKLLSLQVDRLERTIDFEHHADRVLLAENQSLRDQVANQQRFMRQMHELLFRDFLGRASKSEARGAERGRRAILRLVRKYWDDGDQGWIDLEQAIAARGNSTQLTRRNNALEKEQKSNARGKKRGKR